MRRSTFFLWAMICVSWLFFPLVGKKSFKKFTPSVVFIQMIIYFESYIAKKRNWWVILKKVIPMLPGETSLIFGPFLTGSLLILKLTYGKFWLYMLLNLVSGSFFAYPFYFFAKKIGIMKLEKLKKYQLLLLFLNKALIMYGFQYFVVDKGLRK
ncbi:hypothetical protein ACOI1C_10075 [Bacillus sp. DJP31]|uniref:hypothetical protein n=1 Tax=Bacillus sp. DJP31 TaxID=3409789 RepID=UPI003BB51C14